MQAYYRQEQLSDFGSQGQKKLSVARVLVVGAGGLGCPILLYLAACGVGTLGIIDGDMVTETNLHRQILYSPNDIGKLKATIAAQFLGERYPNCNVHAYPEYLNTSNALDLFNYYDLIVDGTDNFQTRYLINDACNLTNIPWVFGSVYKNEGQWALFNYPDKGIKTCYRDLLPKPPEPHQIPDCNETGVLGVVPGLLGMHMASLCIQVLANYGTIPANTLFYYNYVQNSINRYVLTPQQQATNAYPSSRQAFEAFDYPEFCNMAASATWTEAENEAISKKCLFVDIRELYELPKAHVVHVTAPLSAGLPSAALFAEADTIFIYCQTGVRSAKACKVLSERIPGKRFISISGGIEALTYGTKT